MHQSGLAAACTENPEALSSRNVRLQPTTNSALLLFPSTSSLSRTLTSIPLLYDLPRPFCSPSPLHWLTCSPRPRLCASHCRCCVVKRLPVRKEKMPSPSRLAYSIPSLPAPAGLGPRRHRCWAPTAVRKPCAHNFSFALHLPFVSVCVLANHPCALMQDETCRCASLCLSLLYRFPSSQQQNLQSTAAQCSFTCPERSRRHLPCLTCLTSRLTFQPKQPVSTRLRPASRLSAPKTAHTYVPPPTGRPCPKKPHPTS
jgi:hypothetical protein